MFEVIASVVKQIDKFGDLKERLNELKSKDLLVGIPQEKASRPGDEGVNNAELAYFHTHGVRNIDMRRAMQPELNAGTAYSKAHQMYIEANGSPLWNSPPRPIIEPAIKHYQKEIAQLLKDVLERALEDRDFNYLLKKAGMAAQNYVRDWFTNPANGWAPNSPDTIEKKGSDRPLIDTGELRKSITYVIREV